MGKVLGNERWAWFKFFNGLIGVSCTIVWLVFTVGTPVVISLGGVPVFGSLVFSMILLGNGYGLWHLGKEGHDTLQAHRAIRAMHKNYSDYQGGRD